MYNIRQSKTVDFNKICVILVRKFSNGNVEKKLLRHHGPCINWVGSRHSESIGTYTLRQYGHLFLLSTCSLRSHVIVSTSHVISCPLSEKNPVVLSKWSPTRGDKHNISLREESRSCTWHRRSTYAPGAHMTAQVISESSNRVTAQVIDSTVHHIKNTSKNTHYPICKRRH